MDYREAGVDVEAGRAFVEGIRNLVHRTHRSEVIGGLGGFSGYFRLPTGFKEPVLVSGTDGVGTKLKIAQDLNCHETIGIDLVAMCVNDVLTSGAEPLFFLDYLATGQLDRSQLTQVIAGITEGCQLAGCTLLGGETAEMPGFYGAGVYDLAGFCVGIVERSQLLDGEQVKVGDIAIGLASAGVHSNGYSLVRKIVERNNFSWSDTPPQLSGQSLGDVLLAPTRIYVKPVLAARAAGIQIHGMAHVTGGGLPENLPRCLGKGQSIRIDIGSWPILPIFDWLAVSGEVSPKAMFDTFNMGIGYMLLVSPEQTKQTISWFESHNIAAYAIGEVIAGNGGAIGLP
ncbi:phosphoribosylformylglycinamidine cyclo-ligase [Planktothrix sp. FACHB-1355]|uniref:Phosphoribosylformylglycinamidine cyclo-ligase n=1 Tax=Aerosakkonema funiforme FACHB-1375 TaxID=2949571 RepID=A0A926ZJ41_9CYAN|nr:MULTISPECIES: phosphoribosylformylglycinamidine cyclo-ligase [Oscillatoriales]MBD2183952.1 phosphoribosylformylglycinamidine cyclo-ligase [Aerosakkonema funiforme FACHB-1375]MBD3562807.1 phosphoribosylformylglycinamidine cyclo-ligase [Planktothrix sp. FACHB-1355]